MAILVIVGEGKQTSIHSSQREIGAWLMKKRSFNHASIVANFAAYTFAPAILVTPLGALSVIIG